MARRKTALIALVVALSACTPTPSDPTATNGSTTEATGSSTTTTHPDPTTTVVDPPHPSVDVPTAAEFDTFVDETTIRLLELEPQTVTDIGGRTVVGLVDTTLDDLSPDTAALRIHIAERAIDALDGVDRHSLTSDQRISAAILEWYLSDIVALGAYPDHAYAANYITGYHAWFPEFMADIHPIDDLPGAESYVARLEAVGRQMEQVAHQVRRSANAGVLSTTIGRDIAVWQANNVVGPAASHPLVTDFTTRCQAAGIDQATIDSLVVRATAAIDDSVNPGYEALVATLTDVDTRPDSTPGLLEVPDGDAYYRTVLRHYVSDDVDPRTVHDRGRAEVDRVTVELADALDAAGFDVDDLGLAGAIAAADDAAGTTRLASDHDREVFLRATDARIDDSVSRFSDLFESLPVTPVEIVRPRPGRESGSGAYYNAPPMDGSRPGRYYLSLASDAFPMLTYRTTNHHEAIPGHHFQLALQRESTGLPILQRSATFSGYAEGWGLYAERLAFEAGIYDDDPLGDIGRLRMELLRAARVVADTGIHALGWSRSEAIDYLTDLGFAETNAASEVDRYIVWPGQAPAYTLGMLKILGLRTRATEALGDDFDLAAFHTEVLRHGSVPLAVLDDVIGSWIDEQR
ncbi:MAG: DUF885 domain-containing protein [Acidimicrobiia bacterium]|nr:DUF885 domain-containing protein [Acidimicrobiia bacterium]